MVRTRGQADPERYLSAIVFCFDFALDEYWRITGSRLIEYMVMSTEIISIRVDAEAARVFNALPEEDRRRLEAILSIRLSEITHGGESLEAVMQEISEKAKAHGLTPEILKSLLNDQ